MSGFSADWLALREPADREARDPELLLAAVGYLRRHPRARVVDLGCGSGSTVRTLAPHGPSSLRWCLVDHDRALLERALDGLPQACAREHVEAVQADLEDELESVLREPADLVTLSAFLDLASQAWIDRLALAARRIGAAVYAALNYDGRTGCEPFDAFDPAVLDAFNAHQRQDKGLGAALGPRAGEAAACAFRAEGFDVRTARADWRVDARFPELQRQLLAGWVGAVAETGRVDADALGRWHARRLREVDSGQLTLTVGHLDVLAVPTSATAAR